TLPEYMVPSFFVFLESFPLMPNGKINRRALPAPEGGTLERANRFVAPRTPVEEVLVGIWADVLNRDRIGVEDNFFELGGHSLLATQVISRISASFQVQLPLNQLFAGPTIAELAIAIEHASLMGQRLLSSPILPVERTEHVPLTFAQERIWFADQLNPNSYAYNIPEVVRLQGPLDFEAMQRAFGELIRRHETLRTTFTQVDGKPVQVIAPYTGFTLPVLDLTDLPDAEREAKAIEIANKYAIEPFDLKKGPLMNARMIKLADDDHLMVPIFHHIIADGWSMGVLFSEIVAHYEAFRHDNVSPLPELAVQYADFAYWQREWLQGDSIDKQLAYWKKQLSGDLPVMQLPTDRPRPKVQGFSGQFLGFQLTQELSEKMYALTKQEGATMYMTLLSAFNTLLYRYSGLEDILVGSPIAGRNREEIEGLIGVFVNPIVMRTDMSGSPTFRELIAQVRKVALEAYANQDVPFEKLVEELHPERNLSHHPIFQVMFTMQNAPKSSLQLPGLTLEVDELTLTRVGVKKAAAKFDIGFHIVESEQGIIGMLEYNTDLFDEKTMFRMIDNLKLLLENAVSDPDQTVDELLPLLTQEELHKILVDWNDTDHDWGLAPQEMTLPHLITAQAERTPQNVAVVFEGQELTYAELNQRANQVAHHLQKRGIGPEKRVALIVEPSLEMMVGILGIMKAGGAYVPIDPINPAERIGHVLRDSEASVLLTQQHLVAKLPPHTQQAICLDSDWATIAQEPAHNPESGLTADNLAYIIYTSGSTGTPKGVMLEHRGVVNYMLWALDVIDMNKGEGSTVHSSIGFDLPMTGMYPPLLMGKRLVLVNHTQDVGALGAELLVTESPFGLLKLTPAHLQLLNQQLPPGKLAGCACAIVTGGETLTMEHLSHWRKYAPDTVLINEYGPTESTIACTFYEVTGDVELTGGKVPIGRPLPNTKMYVVDRHMQPVPIGVPGELLIGGVGVARGYVNQPELTAEKFIADPFSGRPGARLYRTGDLVRYLPDGNLEFIGRIDNQVKIRGYRIELGEIEEVLVQHPAVTEAVVIAREESSGDKRLIGYVTTGGAEVAVGELRDHVKDKLPEYMVPAVFMVLDKLPLTANGKVDRKKLPVPEQDLSDEAGYVAPRDEVEEVLADIFADLLHLERVGIHDNFFVLGGHSLLATQVVSRVKAMFEVDLQVRVIFEHSTVAELAEAIVDSLDLSETSDAMSGPIPRLPKQDEYELSHAQERIWFVTQMDEKAQQGSLMSMMLNGPLDVVAFRAAVDALPDHHSIMRTVFGERFGKPFQKVKDEMEVTCAYHDLSELDEAARKQQLTALIAADRDRRIDLLNGPLFRMALYKLTNDQHLFVLNAHHIAYDGWALDVLMRDIATGYLQLIGGQASVELPPALQYVDFAVWHNELLASGALDAQRDFWLNHLEGVRGAVKLAHDEQSDVLADPAELVMLTLDAATAKKLRDLTQKSESTLYMTTLSALKIWMALLTGETDITVGSPLSGRNHSDLESMIGVLINP
ncbi:MAG: amino acid adenylation domain-containing protein, partial [Tumebacillaceae bacterium]